MRLLQTIQKDAPISCAKGFWDIAENVINVPFSIRSTYKSDVVVPFGSAFLDLSVSGELLHVEILAPSKIDWIAVPDIHTPLNIPTGRLTLNNDYDFDLVGKYFRTKRGNKFSIVMSNDTKEWLRIADTVVVGIDSQDEISCMIFEKVVKDILLTRLIAWHFIKCWKPLRGRKSRTS